MIDSEWKTNIVNMIFALSNRLQKIGDDLDEDTTVKQRLFITAVSGFKEAPTLSELAASVGCSRQNAKRMAVDLEEMGFVVISKDEQDARALRICLTPGGEEYFENLGDWAKEPLDTLFTGFDDESMHGLHKGLLRLARNANLNMNTNGSTALESGGT